MGEDLLQHTGGDGRNSLTDRLVRAWRSRQTGVRRVLGAAALEASSEEPALSAVEVRNDLGQGPSTVLRVNSPLGTQEK